MGVDIDSDAIQRLLRAPEVACVIITSAIRTCSARGEHLHARNLGHAFKVNFCKYTNQTRLSIEDASALWAALHRHERRRLRRSYGFPRVRGDLVDDRRSAVALPEVRSRSAPGTGGLTRVVDKRKVRRDRAEHLQHARRGQGQACGQVGSRGRGLSRFDDAIASRASEIAGEGHADRSGITLNPIEAEVDDDGNRTYEHVSLVFGPEPRVATITVKAPASVVDVPDTPSELGDTWWPLKAMRELDDALLHLRFNHLGTGLVLLKTEGDAANVLATDAQLLAPPTTGTCGR